MRNAGEDVPSFLDRQEDYSVNNARVMSILCQTISTQVLSLFVSHSVTTPFEAWTVLIGHFERSSLPEEESGPLRPALGQFQSSAVPPIDVKMVRV